MSALSSFLLCLVLSAVVRSAVVLSSPIIEEPSESSGEEPQLLITGNGHTPPSTPPSFPCHSDAPTTTSAPCQVATTATTSPCSSTTATAAPCQQAPTATVAPCAEPVPELVFDSCHCPNGWVSYMDSCYMIERNQKMSMIDAENTCKKLGATLFVANSNDEYTTITQYAPKHHHSWVGLFKKAATEDAQWQMNTCFDYKNEINWLASPPFVPAHNGWTSVSQCAAHFSSFSNYTFFYPCSLPLHFICERNSTIAGTAAQHADRYFF